MKCHWNTVKTKTSEHTMSGVEKEIPDIDKSQMKEIPDSKESQMKEIPDSKESQMKEILGSIIKSSRFRFYTQSSKRVFPMWD